MAVAPVDLTRPVPPHPARWNRAALGAAHKRLSARFGLHPARVLDPFAGVGRIHELQAFGWLTVGGELEPAWAAAHPDTIVADALAFPAKDGAFDAVVTSPTWGSRMADHHDAKERCKPCAGTGRVAALDEYEAGAGAGSPGRTCPKCDGTGRRDHERNTYRHKLGAPLSDGSSAGMNWGAEYRRFHRDWIVEAIRLVPRARRVDDVLVDRGGLIIVNVANHIRKHTEVDVVGWWLTALHAEGLFIRAVDLVPAAKLRHGSNHEARVEGECNIVCETRP